MYRVLPFYMYLFLSTLDIKDIQVWRKMRASTLFNSDRHQAEYL